MPQAPTPPPPPGFSVVEDEPQIRPQGAPSSYNFPGGSELVKNLGIGVAKGAASTVEGGGAMLRRYLPFLNDLPEFRFPLNIDASNAQQEFGKGLEHAGEFALGGARVPFTAIPQALMAAGISGAHSGGDPGTMLGTGIIGGLTPAIAGMLSKTLPVQAYSRLKAWISGAGAPVHPPGSSNVSQWFRGLPEGVPEFTSYRDVTPPSLPPGMEAPEQGGGPGGNQLGPGRTFYQSGQPQGQVEGSPTSPQLPSGPAPPPQLNAGPGTMVPRGTGRIPVNPESSLPSHYANMPVNAPQAPPGTMGGMRLGEEGGIPARGEQTVTGTHLPLSRVPKGEPGAGRFRQLTSQELDQFLKEKGAAGRTAAIPETAPTPPPKPKGPSKTTGKKK